MCIVNDNQESYWTESYIDKIRDMMRHRKIKSHSSLNKVMKITSNRTILEYTREYIRIIDNKKNILKLINHVRYYK